jgi:hypothetical protein
MGFSQLAALQIVKNPVQMTCPASTQLTPGCGCGRRGGETGTRWQNTM